MSEHTWVFFLVLFLKTGELLGLVHCTTGRTRTSSTEALRQRAEEQ